MPKIQTSILDFFNRKKYISHNKRHVNLKKSQQNSDNTLFSYNKKRNYKESRNFINNQVSLYVDHKINWKGFCFIATNNYMEWVIKTTFPRRDSINGQFYDIGFEVGSATLDGNSALTNIEIKIPFRRGGLGSKFIQVINKSCQQFHVYGGGGNNSRYRLTEEGEQLIKASVRKGILLEEQVIFGTVPESQNTLSIE